jgi:hypothetical protein
LGTGSFANSPPVRSTNDALTQAGLLSKQQTLSHELSGFLPTKSLD